MSGGMKKQDTHRPSSIPVPRSAVFPIVGIGASAGGFDAFVEILGALSANSGMAYVLIQHLDPAHESMLPALLARKSTLPVNQVTDGMAIEPNHVYVIPPNTNMGIHHGRLKLTERAPTGERSMPIDYFFQSLASYSKDGAIGVVLSGTATDGTLGLKAIRSEGGMCFAQDEKSAKYTGMPASAIASGCVDFVGPPRRISAELIRIARYKRVNSLVSGGAGVGSQVDDDDLPKLMALIRNVTGADVTHYKSSTIRRRIGRRMLLKNIPSIREYIKVLRRDRAELGALHEDILIRVTCFFREPETFRILEKRIIPKLSESQSDRNELRVWVPGCSTGEEAYSIAIVLAEFMEDRLGQMSAQIFGTDLSEWSVERARAGAYEGATLGDVSPERLERFFVKQGRGYRVTQSIRDMCTFASHDLTKDPAFSRIDLISCRNVLIYLEPVLQKKVLATFHYALNSNGILLLGKSEALNAFPDLFRPIEGKGKFFRKRAGRSSPGLRTFPSLAATGLLGGSSKPGVPPSSLQREADRLVWIHYGHAGVIVDEGLQILHFRGDASLYLSPTSGTASLNLPKMVRGELLLDLRSAFLKAKKERAPVRREGIHTHFGGRAREISIEIVPLSSLQGLNRHFLILFEEASPPQDQPISQAKKDISAHKKLRQEVVATREHLRSIVEELETTIDQLKAANEESLSNEELQSTNEAMETVKEELQSTNEELGSLTEQQSARNIELTLLNDDLKNVLEVLQIPILILSKDQIIRRFTTSAEKVFNLLPTDVGRPIQDLRPNLDVPDLQGLLSRTIDRIEPLEQEVRDLSGRYYAMTVRPYRTSDNRVDGVVIALVDTDSMKRSLNEAERARDYATAIVNTVREPLVVLDSALRMVTANRSFFETFRVSRDELRASGAFDVANGVWDNPEFRELLAKIQLGKSRYEDVRVTPVFPKIGRRTLLLNARRIEWDGDVRVMILLAMEDITERESTTEALRESHERSRELAERLLSAQESERRRISRDLHDDFNQRLAMLALELETLEKSPAQAGGLTQRKLASLRSSTEGISEDLRRLAHQLHPSVVDHLGLPAALRSLCKDFTREKSLRINYRQQGVGDSMPTDIALCIYRVAQTALHNVALHSGTDRVTVSLMGGSQKIMLSVHDAGVGFDLEQVKGKKGLGIMSMEERARLAGGTFTLRSKPGHGTRISIAIPLPVAVLAGDAS
jgi:two-component system CheB/CheR fusion protein